jgi:hypothetical protein
MTTTLSTFGVISRIGSGFLELNSVSRTHVKKRVPVEAHTGGGRR